MEAYVDSIRANHMGSRSGGSDAYLLENYATTLWRMVQLISARVLILIFLIPLSAEMASLVEKWLSATQVMTWSETGNELDKVTGLGYLLVAENISTYDSDIAPETA